MSAQVPTQRFNSERIWFATFLAVAFAAGVIVSSLVAVALSRPGVPASGDARVTEVSGPAANDYSVYRATTSRLAAAVARHDWSTAAQFRSQLDGQMTRATIDAVYADHARLMSNMAAAAARHDRKLYEEFKLQLGGLCPALSGKSDPSFCN
jgi:hypothetical protein